MKLLQLTLSALLVVVASAQQSHPQLQAYLAQQQQLQQQQLLQQQPARQQYRLLQQPQVQQQYSSEDDSSAQQYQQLPQLSPQLYRAQAAAAQQQQQQHQQQQQQHQQQLSPAAIARLRAVQAAQQQSQGGTPLENPEDYDPNPQYQFGFDVKDDQYTNYQNRKEQREGDKITGSYSVVDSDGFIRTVTYTADPKEGFKAEVTRTPTDIVVKLPTPPPQQLTEAAGLQRQLAARQQQYEQPQPVQYSSRPAYSVQPQHSAAASHSPAQLQQLLAAQQRPLLRAAAASPSAAYQTYQQQ